MNGPVRRPLPVTLTDLPHLWWHDTIRIICARPEDLEDVPDLATRIRGAFGRALAEVPSSAPGRDDPFSRPAPFDLFFGMAEDSLPPPMVIDVDVVGDQVIVDLRLFGEGGYYLEPCRQALIDALAGGVAIRAGSRARVPFEPLDCLVRRDLPLEPITGAREAVVACRTPVAVRTGAALITRPISIIQASILRVRNLAPWLGLEPLADWASLRAECEELTVIEDSLVPVGFTRHSQRRGDSTIPVTGFMGRLVVRGDLTRLALFLSLAGLHHLGSHAALGLGRVNVSLYR